MDQYRKSGPPAVLPPGSLSSSQAASVEGGEAATAVRGTGKPAKRKQPTSRPDFQSIVFAAPENYPDVDKAAVPDSFRDLNLDQVVSTVTTGRGEYNLAPFFYCPLKTLDEVAYRHEVLRDLEKPDLKLAVESFARDMRAMRKHLEQAGKLHYIGQKQAWFLDAVHVYCRGVASLFDAVATAEPKSRGLASLTDFLAAYIASRRFAELSQTSSSLKADLAAVTYNVELNGGSLNVRPYRDEADYSAEIESTFERFRQGAVKDYSHKLLDWEGMNHIEAQILAFVARLHPDLFSRLQRFSDTETGKFSDPTIGRFDREVQFYLAYLDNIDRLKQAGLSFCYPRMLDSSKEVHDTDAFDIALAFKLVGDGKPIVSNDIQLSGQERILVVSGPNQGGKTTFARTFGQVHHLGCLGLLVPGQEAKLFLADAVLTHFEREEDIRNLSGKLQDDLVRIHAILERATPRSIIIMNEIFTSTTLRDATFLSDKVMERIIELDALCVWVTFIHELSTHSKQTVSMVSMVDPANPISRTFKVVRKAASGRSYAMSIAEKYGLTAEQLKERLAP